MQADPATGKEKGVFNPVWLDWFIRLIANIPTTGNTGGGGSTATIGNVTGPGSSVAGDVATFANTAGKTLQDSGILATKIVLGPSTAGDGAVALFDGTTGKLIKDNVDLFVSLGLVLLPTLPAVAPVTSGALWHDPGAANVVKWVP